VLGDRPGHAVIPAWLGYGSRGRTGDFQRLAIVDIVDMCYLGANELAVDIERHQVVVGSFSSLWGKFKQLGKVLDELGGDGVQLDVELL
jgi:hypothetical protein